MPERDLPPPDHVRFQAHECGGLPPLCFAASLLAERGAKHSRLAQRP